MKKQDLIAVAVLALIITFLGVMSVDALFSSPSENFTLSPEPSEIEPGFSEEGIEYLTSDQVEDFTVNVNGVEAPKNPTPFSD